jgi:hypothetical protein
MAKEALGPAEKCFIGRESHDDLLEIEERAGTCSLQNWEHTDGAGCYPTSKGGCFGAELAAAVADVVGVIAAVDRAVGFCRCPLQFLAQILLHEIRQRRISRPPVRPQLPQHKLPLPSL